MKFIYSVKAKKNEGISHLVLTIHILVTFRENFNFQYNKIFINVYIAL